jgi:cytochrome d ubiquinol oxidase subunit II
MREKVLCTEVIDIPVSDQEFAFMLIWVSILVYSVLASLDLGSGFFYLFSFLVRGGDSVRRSLISYSSARWESTNTFFIFIVVAGASYFPSMADILATGWIVLISVILILFMVRAAFLVYDYYSTSRSKLFLCVYSLTGLSILPLMAVIITSSLLNVSTVSYTSIGSGFIVNVDYAALFSNPITYLMIIIAFFGQLMVSGTFSLFYDRDVKNRNFYSRITKIATLVTFLSIVVEFQLYYPLARYLFTQLLHNVVYIAISGILFLIFGFLLFTDRYGLTPFVVLLLSMAFDFVGLGLSKYPYILYPTQTVYTTFTTAGSFYALSVTFFAALILLVPSLYFLNRMFRSPSP